ncbi:MAG TPA: TrbG/VirB9 family P-type conjugative transfer protein [Steroidobacteraceae bacterium]|nr:TrbG/VirB9 family P-type conjugative transfer protein [Steroidobacteraceae bacterium]
MLRTHGARRAHLHFPVGLLAVALTVAGVAGAETDSRIRVTSYNGDRVYRLVGYVGYQIDLEFAADETFVGLGAGDIEGLSFASQGNHLFLKPKAAKVSTNLTVLTNRREYQFDYSAKTGKPDPREPDVTYVLRFTYPQPPAALEVPGRVERQLRSGEALRPRNFDYWYCGSPTLRPVAASDDGVHTHLRFGAHAELPAIFVRNDDGSESLLNFSVESGDVVIHRVAKRFILRRGLLRGCVVNKSFNGGGERLDSGTVSPSVERVTQGGVP